MHYMAFGNQSAAAAEIRTHIQLATTGLVQGSVLGVGVTQTLPLVPGRSYEIPVPVTAGQTLSMLTSGRDSYDTILVLIAPDGTPVLGSGDYKQYFAGFQWVAPTSGMYRVWVTLFESVNAAHLVVSRR
jgi:hypothetical protein